jgi:hypothetical protein
MTTPRKNNAGRPSRDLVTAQRAGKTAWRRAIVNRSFKEKLRILLEMQQRLLPVIARRRALAPWERPWAIDG